MKETKGVEINPIFDVGDFIQNKEPYDSEGEYLIVAFEYYKGGDWYGYRCVFMKGKHVPEHDFDNHIIIDKWHQNSYKKVS